MKRLLAAAHTILLAFLLICVSAAYASDDTPRNGNWWRLLDRTTKLDYVTGMFDGIILGNEFSIWRYPPEAGKTTVSAEAVNSFNSYTSKYLRNVTSSQLADGLDVFYSNFRNRGLNIQNAVWLVLNEISGKPHTEMEKLIEAFRANAR